MRLWSLHPTYLDTKGLLACWRETLLAQKVLDGKTTGYRNHPQLQRLRATAKPLDTVGAYLAGLALEADVRSYRFNRELILCPPAAPPARLLTVTTGQIDYECAHLRSKLAVRDPQREKLLAAAAPLLLHPIFEAVPGDIEPWERPEAGPRA